MGKAKREDGVTSREGFRNRLIEVRTKLGQSQKGMSDVLGLGKNTWQNYESGRQMPGGSIIAKLAEMGFNVNWILTGKGALYIKGADVQKSGTEYTARSRLAEKVDRDRIAECIILVEERISDALPLHMKARMAADLIIQHLENLEED